MAKALIEHQSSQRIKMMQKGFVTGLPILFGYLPIAITYGVLASQSGISLIELTLMSVLVFAGAAQFMGANMIAIGAGSIEIIIATFVLNFRHFVMSLSFMNSARALDLKWKIPLSLGVTDESFSVSSVHKEEANQERGAYFYATLMLTAYLSWVIGSFLGGILGDIMPAALSQSMGIALYAMFIALLIPSVKVEVRYGIVAVIAMVFNYFFSLHLDQGWAIVLSTILASYIGIFFVKVEQK
ncbi:autotransporter [Paraliobacillus quinghaiensis]|uniref:Autotransporter n=1 Tax=Paraliobacillus quinghaiensis TaxID=470815 RepID=A0A917WRM2_9BACI|nr:AzlC family ABC transporter permease [Paraliobacillus quinghaiensis]GGM25653.1 autotransporter [Paraliobacillus quinghaiensis]